MSKRNDDAVSPVVGIMMMLVVTIIIAAIVSGFAGSLTESQSKTPQAKITATFSVSEGMAISHAGGDAIPLNDLVFTTWNGPGFGPNAQKVTTQQLNLDLITDKDGRAVFSTSSIGGKSSFNPGDTLYVTPYNSTCSLFQPGTASALITGDTHCRQGGSGCGWWDWENYPTTYPQPGCTSSCKALWYLCFRNPDNVGKVFTLQVGDRAGNVISTTEVKITA
jgi:FlaG/FlaF family flagellin (archaellin)